MMELINHLLLTEAFLVKGHVDTGGRRLTNFLNGHQKAFFPIYDVTMIAMDGGDKILSNEAFVPLDSVVLAHEFLEEGGDTIAKRLGRKELPTASISAFYRGAFKLDLAGRIRPKTVEDANGVNPFFVVQDPTVAGLGQRKAREFNLLRKLPYLILNRKKLDAVFLYD
ncbi:MAG: hypothetical protein U1E76_11280 [Planctomycetota bacterium]